MPKTKFRQFQIDLEEGGYADINFKENRVTLFNDQNVKLGVLSFDTVKELNKYANPPKPRKAKDK